ncbi:hypothetical protein HDU67_005850, partial [Dinochytrium kinnereticum]
FPSAKSGEFQPYMMFYVNCLEAFVYGFDRLIKARPEMVPTGNGPWNISQTYSIPYDFNFPDIYTVTGPVVLDRKGDRIGSYQLTYFDSRAREWTEFATYEETGLNFTSTVVYSGGSTVKPFGSLREAAPRTVIEPPKLAAVLIIIFTVISVTLCGATIAVLYAYRDRKSFK